MLTPHELHALNYARFYRKKGFNPIPSAMDERKKPLYRFAADYGWNTMFPEEWFREENWKTTNLQVLTGRAYRLIVFDLDGEEAKVRWESMGYTPNTWITHRLGGASWHVWFRLPKDMDEEMRKCFVWKGTEKHTGIERLCDQAMIVAPPSYHIEHKDSQYRFLDNAHSPERLGLPAAAPSWVLKLKPVVSATSVQVSVSAPAARRASTATVRFDSEELPDRNDILDRIYDKIGLLSSWGVQFTGRLTATGWVPCRAVDREDRNPSAAVHQESGVYTDLGSGTRLSMIDLAITLGQATDFQDALRVLKANS